MHAHKGHFVFKDNMIDTCSRVSVTDTISDVLLILCASPFPTALQQHWGVYLRFTQEAFLWQGYGRPGRHLQALDLKNASHAP